MTTDIEKQFFEAFEIKPIIEQEPARMEDGNGELCAWYTNEVYPLITDHILLKLIKIALEVRNYNYTLTQIDVKQQILNDYLNCTASAYKQVRNLFGVTE